MDYEFADEVSSYSIQGSLPGRQHAEPHRAVTSGYLYKLARGRSIVKLWHKRYYVLYSDGLMYSYHSDRALTSSRTIPVGRLCLRMKFGTDTNTSECKSWPSKVPVNQRFSLINSNRSYHFYCDNDKEFSTWKHHLQLTLSKLSSSSQAAIDDPLTPTLTQPDSPTQSHDIISQDDEQPIPTEHSDGDDDVPYDAVYHPPTVVGVRDSDSSSEEESVDIQTVVHTGCKEVHDLLESLFGEITSLDL